MVDLIEAAQMRHYHKKLLEPALKLWYSGLRYYYAFRGLYHEVESKARTEPHGDILNSLARDYKLAICAEELIG